jgi:hypothetical protein
MGKLWEQMEKEKEFLTKCGWQRQLIATRERQGCLSQKEAELQYRAISADEERHQTEVNTLLQLKSDGGDLEQVQALIQRVDWLHRQYNWGDFSDMSDADKRKLLEELVDKIIIGGDNQVEVRLKLPSPHLLEAIVSVSMHGTTCIDTKTMYMPISFQLPVNDLVR